MTNRSNLVLKRYNLGALGVTPLWLFRNGFWLTCIIYFMLAVYYWPGALIISLLFFVKGTVWSWGDGRRWNDAEEFSESQYFWGIAGGLLLILQAIAITLWLFLKAKSI